MAKSIIKIGNFNQVEIPFIGNHDKISVDLGDYLVELTLRQDQEWQVTNAVDGHGINAYQQLKHENVEISYSPFWEKVNDRKFQSYLDGDDPSIIYIHQTSHTSEELYHVIEEDPHNSVYGMMNKQQILEKYKIEL